MKNAQQNIPSAELRNVDAVLVSGNSHDPHVEKVRPHDDHHRFQFRLSLEFHLLSGQNVPMFLGHSYMKYKLFETSSDDMTVVMLFRIKELSGILMHLGQNSSEKGDFAVIYIKHGRIHFKQVILNHYPPES